MIRNLSLALTLLSSSIIIAAPNPAPKDFNVSKSSKNDGDKWAQYLELQGKQGNFRSLARLSWMLPLYQNEDNMLFSDVSFMLDDKNDREANIGLGYRHIIRDWDLLSDGVILGAYGFYDRRKSTLGNKYNQGTFGVEALGNFFRLYGNYYIPQNKKHHLSTTNFPTIMRSGWDIVDSNLFFTYNTLVNTSLKEELTLKGYDFEARFKLPITPNVNLWAGGGAYHFSRSSVKLEGPTAMFDFEMNNALGIRGSRATLGLEYRRIKGGETARYAVLKLTTPLGKVSETLSNPSNIDYEMTRFIVRDVDIQTKVHEHVVPTHLLSSGNSGPREVLTPETKTLQLPHGKAVVLTGENIEDALYDFCKACWSPNNDEPVMLFLGVGQPGTQLTMTPDILSRVAEKLASGEDSEKYQSVIASLRDGRLPFSPTAKVKDVKNHGTNVDPDGHADEISKFLMGESIDRKAYLEVFKQTYAEKGPSAHIGDVEHTPEVVVFEETGMDLPEEGEFEWNTPESGIELDIDTSGDKIKPAIRNLKSDSIDLGQNKKIKLKFVNESTTIPVGHALELAPNQTSFPFVTLVVSPGNAKIKLISLIERSGTPLALPENLQIAKNSNIEFQGNGSNRPAIVKIDISSLSDQDLANLKTNQDVLKNVYLKFDQKSDYDEVAQAVGTDSLENVNVGGVDVVPGNPETWGEAFATTPVKNIIPGLKDPSLTANSLHGLYAYYARYLELFPDEPRNTQTFMKVAGMMVNNMGDIPNNGQIPVQDILDMNQWVKPLIALANDDTMSDRLKESVGKLNAALAPAISYDWWDSATKEQLMAVAMETGKKLKDHPSVAPLLMSVKESGLEEHYNNISGMTRGELIKYIEENSKIKLSKKHMKSIERMGKGKVLTKKSMDELSQLSSETYAKLLNDPVNSNLHEKMTKLRVEDFYNEDTKASLKMSIAGMQDLLSTHPAVMNLKAALKNIEMLEGLNQQTMDHLDMIFGVASQQLNERPDVKAAKDLINTPMISRDDLVGASLGVRDNVYMHPWTDMGRNLVTGIKQSRALEKQTKALLNQTMEAATTALMEDEAYNKIQDAVEKARVLTHHSSELQETALSYAMESLSESPELAKAMGIGNEVYYAAFQHKKNHDIFKEALGKAGEIVQGDKHAKAVTKAFGNKDHNRRLVKQVKRSIKHTALKVQNHPVTKQLAGMEYINCDTKAIAKEGAKKAGHIVKERIKPQVDQANEAIQDIITDFLASSMQDGSPAANLMQAFQSIDHPEKEGLKTTQMTLATLSNTVGADGILNMMMFAGPKAEKEFVNVVSKLGETPEMKPALDDIVISYIENGDQTTQAFKDASGMLFWHMKQRQGVSSTLLDQLDRLRLGTGLATDKQNVAIGLRNEFESNAYSVARFMKDASVPEALAVIRTSASPREENLELRRKQAQKFSAMWTRDFSNASPATQQMFDNFTNKLKHRLGAAFEYWMYQDLED